MFLWLFPYTPQWLASIDYWFFSWTVWLLGLVALLNVSTYLVPWLLVKYLAKPQHLGKKYDARWALVTGGSSGIGKALSFRLAEQGINVIIAAYPDKLLKETVDELSAKYKAQEFKAVSVDLSRPGYMDELRKATDGLNVNLIFSNAGFITTGFFVDSPAGRQVANYHCNATAAVEIAHHFVGEMKRRGQKGALILTSSPASILPTPFSVIYGSTKSFLTEFGASLAPEVKSDGIDVLVVNPSPVSSNFYNKAHKIDTIEMFKKTGTTGETIADAAFAAVGRVTVVDQGYYPISMNMLLKLVDWHFIVEIMTRFSHTFPDFKQVKADDARKAAEAAKKAAPIAKVDAADKEEKAE